MGSTPRARVPVVPHEASPPTLSAVHASASAAVVLAPLARVVAPADVLAVVVSADEPPSSPPHAAAVRLSATTPIKNLDRIELLLARRVRWTPVAVPLWMQAHFAVA